MNEMNLEVLIPPLFTLPKREKEGVNSAKPLIRLLANSRGVIQKINLVNNFTKPKSKAPKNMAVPAEMLKTKIVYIMVCCLVGQSTFLPSITTSLKNSFILSIICILF